MNKKLIAALAAALLCVSPITVPTLVSGASAALAATYQQGTASWYGPGFNGRRTANGETFNMNALTAAHKTLPFGTRVKVTNLHNGKVVVVRINDRGPYAHGRVIDLSRAAAQDIGMIGAGTAPVKLEIIR
ncbi:MAG: septal ring lytic transglycosylase RlpA family protein [Hyphomicrobiaceae bacterium]|nr:septal ring lytic transglycosylase RlpA family protein [Hyphomicrobiaceae bacterium]MCC0024340.1 septal ring lytic transglycosylase RlpA family protein [Hyphomicrobiaceae bacterium]